MRSVRSVEYVIHFVTSLTDLVDMMRYDGMRFMTNNTDELIKFRMLAEHDAGIVNKDFPNDGLMIQLIKDQPKDWIPTFDRWKSFGMEPVRTCNWHEAREIA